MVILRRRSRAEQHRLDDLVPIDGMAQSLADALVLELLDLRVHAGDDGLRGLDLVDRDMRKGLHRVDLYGIGFRKAVDLL